MEQFTAYFSKALSGCKPFVGGLIGAINYILFPAEAFRTAAMALGVAMLLDILTKYVTLSREARGFMKAVKTGRIRSEALWYGTKIKLYSYLVIAILSGLSYRVVQLEQLSVFFASVVYSVLFLREAQSILENLCDGGADLRWALIWAKQKERDILDQTEEVEAAEEKKEGI